MEIQDLQVRKVLLEIQVQQVLAEHLVLQERLDRKDLKGLKAYEELEVHEDLVVKQDPQVIVEHPVLKADKVQLEQQELMVSPVPKDHVVSLELKDPVDQLARLEQEVKSVFRVNLVAKAQKVGVVLLDQLVRLVRLDHLDLEDQPDQKVPMETKVHQEPMDHQEVLELRAGEVVQVCADHWVLRVIEVNQVLVETKVREDVLERRVHQGHRDVLDHVEHLEYVSPVVDQSVLRLCGDLSTLLLKVQKNSRLETNGIRHQRPT